MNTTTSRIDDVNFALHPNTNPYDWYEREFLRMAYKMQRLSADEASVNAHPGHATPPATGGGGRRPRKRRAAAASENLPQ